MSAPSEKRTYQFAAVASDMDGTLLQPNHNVTDFTRRAVNYVSRTLGVPFVFATGRHHGDVLATQRKLGLYGYVITSNGARAHDPDGKVIVKRDLPPEMAKTLAMFVLDDPEIVMSIYQEDHWYMIRDAKDLTEYYQDNKDVFFYELFDPKTHPSYEGVYKVYYTSDNRPKLDQLDAAIQEKFGKSVSSAYSVPTALEVTAGGVNKGDTLGAVLKEYVFANDPRSREELLQATVAFGDGQNDYDLLMACGKGCVMGNAQAVLVGRLPKNDPHLEFVGKNTEEGEPRKLMELFHFTESDM